MPFCPSLPPGVLVPTHSCACVSMHACVCALPVGIVQVQHTPVLQSSAMVFNAPVSCSCNHSSCALEAVSNLPFEHLSEKKRQACGVLHPPTHFFLPSPRKTPKQHSENLPTTCPKTLCIALIAFSESPQIRTCCLKVFKGMREI